MRGIYCEENLDFFVFVAQYRVRYSNPRATNSTTTQGERGTVSSHHHEGIFGPVTQAFKHLTAGLGGDHHATASGRVDEARLSLYDSPYAKTKGDRSGTVANTIMHDPGPSFVPSVDGLSKAATVALGLGAAGLDPPPQETKKSLKKNAVTELFKDKASHLTKDPIEELYVTKGGKQIVDLTRMSFPYLEWPPHLVEMPPLDFANWVYSEYVDAKSRHVKCIPLR